MTTAAPSTAKRSLSKTARSFCTRLGPGFDAGNLVDWVSFTALWLRGKAAPQAPRC